MRDAVISLATIKWTSSSLTPMHTPTSSNSCGGRQNILWGIYRRPCFSWPSQMGTFTSISFLWPLQPSKTPTIPKNNLPISTTFLQVWCYFYSGKWSHFGYRLTAFYVLTLLFWWLWMDCYASAIMLSKNWENPRGTLIINYPQVRFQLFAQVRSR